MKYQKTCLEVTQDDINKGIKGNPVCCPIANAICRKWEAPWCSIFTEDTAGGCVALLPNGNLITFELVGGTTFGQMFDAGEKVEPTTFEVRINL